MMLDGALNGCDSAMTPPDTRPLQQALRTVLGPDRVCADPTALARLARTTAIEGTTPGLIVYPRTCHDVAAVMKLARDHRCGVHPVSCGRNWGYGDACGTRDGQIILDMSRMNAIVEVDAELGYAVVEPGVTQGQLADYLKSNNLPFTADASGAGRDASIVGNVAERGFGHSQNGDRFANVANLEVVLPNGRILNTGLGHFPGARAAHCYKWGLGPSLDGLFTQSNLGVITRLTFWLVPKTEQFAAFFFLADREENIGDIIEALRPLRMRGTLRTAIHIFNDLRLITGAQLAPARVDPESAALSPAEITALRRQHGIGAWAGSGALYGSPAEIRAAAQAVKRALRRVRGVSTVVVINRTQLEFIEAFVKPLKKLHWCASLVARVEKLRLGFDLLSGIPSNDSLTGGMWRAPGTIERPPTPGDDPLDYRAGFLWVSPLIPMRKHDVDTFLALVKPIFARYRFDFQITLSLVTARALCGVSTISFDRDNAAETARAHECYQVLLTTLFAQGFIPYRMSNLSMAAIPAGTDSFFDLVHELKQHLDPTNTLSPGHYDPLSSAAL